jgi:hypothetical protein
MRARSDSALISSALFTLALLSLAPSALWDFSGGTDARLDAGWQSAAYMAHYLGVACLAIILIGLIVVWTGYVRCSRSAWLVMFVVTWAWAFPTFALPQLKGPRVFTLPEWIYNAIHGPWPPRSPAQMGVIFALMVIALLLPIRSFFFASETSTLNQKPSLKRMGRTVVIALLILVALFVWVHAQVYEIPLDQLNELFVPPAPPPFATPHQSQRLSNANQ